MDRAIAKDKSGQPGSVMEEVWLLSDDKFDDGIKDVIPEPGAKPANHSPYYAALLQKHNVKNEEICTDCGRGFSLKNRNKIKNKNERVGQRCPKCFKIYWKDRNERRHRDEQRKKETLA